MRLTTRGRWLARLAFAALLVAAFTFGATLPDTPWWMR